MGKRFTASEITRAVSACKDAKMEVGEVVIEPDGRVRIVASRPALTIEGQIDGINPADLIDP